MNPRVITQSLRSQRALLASAAGLALAFAQAHAAPATPAAPAAPAPGAPITSAPAPAPVAQSAVQIVLQNGRSLPISAVVLKGDKFEIKSEVIGINDFTVGKLIDFDKVDHVFGPKPPGINQGIALILTGKPAEGRKLLLPILAEHKDTAKLPGNYWLEAARAALVANALEGSAPSCATLGKEISDATPAAGPDPFVALGKALLLHTTVKLAEREAALRAQVTDNQPADVCAYASIFLGNLLQSDKRNDAALEAYLAVPCLYPSGGLVMTGVAQFKAAEVLTSQGFRKEAMPLILSAMRNTKDTPAKDLLAKLLESIK